MTRRILFGFPALITTFLAAYILVAQYRSVLTNMPNPTAETAHPTEAEDPFAEPPGGAQVPDDLETVDEVSGDRNQRTSKKSIQLVATGGELLSDARNGENWLGLFEVNGNYFLRSEKLKVSRESEEPDTDCEGDLPTIKVSVPGPNRPLFLVKNASTLHEGTVTTAFRGMDEAIRRKLERLHIDTPDTYTNTFLEKDFSRTFKIGGQTFAIGVSAAKNRAGEEVLVLFLYAGNIRQVLGTVKGSDYAMMGQLYWIGDLDGDGQPDIYCLLYGDTGDAGNVLFLSSGADKGKIVKKVAQFAWEDDC